MAAHFRPALTSCGRRGHLDQPGGGPAAAVPAKPAAKPAAAPSTPSPAALERYALSNFLNERVSVVPSGCVPPTSDFQAYRLQVVKLLDAHTHGCGWSLALVSDGTACLAAVLHGLAAPPRLHDTVLVTSSGWAAGNVGGSTALLPAFGCATGGLLAGTPLPAGAEGPYLLGLTGDGQRLGFHPSTTGVWELTLAELEQQSGELALCLDTTAEGGPPRQCEVKVTKRSGDANLLVSTRLAGPVAEAFVTFTIAGRAGGADLTVPTSVRVYDGSSSLCKTLAIAEHHVEGGKVTLKVQVHYRATVELLATLELKAAASGLKGSACMHCGVASALGSDCLKCAQALCGDCAAQHMGAACEVPACGHRHCLGCDKDDRLSVRCGLCTRVEARPRRPRSCQRWC